jgi:hypothetical protein
MPKEVNEILLSLETDLIVTFALLLIVTATTTGAVMYHALEQYKLLSSKKKLMLGIVLSIAAAGQFLLGGWLLNWIIYIHPALT